MADFPLPDLISGYRSLPPLEQEMLRYHAGYAQPLNRYQFAFFGSIKSAPQGKAALSTASITSTLEKFRSMKLVFETNQGFLINLQIVDYVMREILDRKELQDIKLLAAKTRPLTHWSHYDYRGVIQLIESVYLGNEVEALQRFSQLVAGSFPLLEPFDHKWFASFSPRLKTLFVRHTLSRVLRGHSILSAPPDADALAAAQHWIKTELIPNGNDETRGEVLEWALASGDRQTLGLLDEVTGGKTLDVAGCRALLDGDIELAGQWLAKTTAKRPSVKALTCNGQLPSLFYFLLKLSGSCGPAGNDVVKAINLGERQGMVYLDSFKSLQQGMAYRAKPVAGLVKDLYGFAPTRFPIDYLTIGYLKLWLQFECSTEEVEKFNRLLNRMEVYFRLSGCHFLATEAVVLAGRAPVATGDTKFKSLAAHLKPLPAWEQRLQSILDLVSVPTAQSSGDASDGASDRLIFEISVGRESFQLDAFHQTRKGSEWTRGRKVSLKRLVEGTDSSEFAFLTEKDRDLIKSFRISMDYGRYGAQEIVEIIPEKAARSLVGHPHVYHPGNREQAIEIVEAPPRLIVEKVGTNEVKLRLDPQPLREGYPLKLHYPSPGQLVITTFDDTTLRLHQKLGDGLQLPGEAIHRLPAILRPLSSVVMVHSEVEMGDTATSEGGFHGLLKAEVIEGERLPYIHLFPSGGGYCLDVFVHPFGKNGPNCRPGEGGRKLFANIDGKSVTANRDLALETTTANELLDRCPQTRTWLQSPWSAIMPTAVDALEVLLELEAASREGHCRLMWPHGKELRIAGQAGSSNLQVRIKKDHDWFAASGTLEVDSTLAVDMLKLTELVATSPGRFVQLDDGRFLALTEQLRRQIGEFTGFGDRRKTGSLRFSAVHAGLFENLAEVKIKSDSHWRSLQERMRAAQELEPRLPAGLLAELRDYQEDGYKWMSRLAAWGVGGCLADDMGLGKTIQALALLLERATGPALVIAPTSVVFNWSAELQRFAPTLRPRLVADEAASDELADLQPNDVVLCSYGLLQHRTAMLKATEWNTLILDEAQAIKNTTTQRSQSAKSLKANFRMIMTGTPVENHLGELWNLMDFVNPGILGSAEAFQQRFATPIERDHCRQTKSRLKKLISPFLLRRTKAQVLSELPSRTEIMLRVTLSPSEAAFYETLRQQAVKKLAGIGSKKTSQLQILAEIMRLRRACCHPQLVSGGAAIECSKLKLFSETVDELLSGGHKALVFSQFVDHLAILRQELERKNISYQYLDGSTPAAKRKKSVEAFQSGEGDLFLISLKAGGSGLNLTAADYVLHMDPWWNPAVEDQASDRAHRMGQQRPVTIYRFITDGTIEHKIQQLHGTKRDLADTLLEGSDQGGKLSAEELLALLRK